MRLRLILALTSLATASFSALSAAEKIADLALYANGEVVTMDKFEVVGTQTTAVDTTVQKLPTTVKDTARSLTTIDSSRLREQDFQVGSDLLFWIPGLNTNGAVQESYHFYARGYRMTANEWRVDGFAGRIIGGSYSPNLFGYEQVVALKGPSGLLYGNASSPGGLINLITKKPQEQTAINIDTRTRTFAGNDSGFGDRVSAEVELDATGKLTNDGRLLYRLLGSVEQTALTYSGQTDANQFYRLSFTYKLDAAGRFRFTPLFEWSEESRASRNAVISPSSSRTTADGSTGYTTADVSPRDVNLAAGERVDRNRTLGADLTLDFTSDWTAALSFRSHQRDMNNNAWSIQPLTLAQTNPADPKSWVIGRLHARSRSDIGTFSYDANTAYKFLNTSSVKSLLQLGLNGRVTESQAYTFTATTNPTQSPVNIYTGLASSPLVEYVPATPALGNLTRTDVWNAYIQSQTEFWEKLVATVGFARATEKTRITTPANVTTASPTRNSDLTPNVGLVYRLTKDISVYASYSNSYTLVDPTSEDASGNTGGFSPTEGDNYEIGLKGDFFKRRISGVTAFTTELNNVLVQSDTTELNPRGNRFYRQLDTGRVSDGVETELVFRPVPHWETSATYTYIDARNRNLDGSDGAPAEMTPHHAVSVYSRYTFTEGPLAKWSVRLGYIWQSDRVGGSASPTAAAPDPLILDCFHRIDAGISRKWTHWNVALNIENLTDNYYLLAGSTGVTMSPVNPRSLALRVGYSW